MATSAGVQTSKGMQGMMWIMRHARAGPTTDAKTDDQRPLDSSGVRDAHVAGVALRRLQTPIQYCMASPLRRTMETAEIVCKELGLTVVPEPKLAGQPLSVPDVKTLTSGHGNCLLVGHAPSVNLIVYQFTGAQVQFAKGGLAQIHEGEVWTLLNPSTCYVMADQGKVPFTDPQEVDERSSDDWATKKARIRRPWRL